MIKVIVLGLAIATSVGQAAERMCTVEVCNKIERFSLDPFSHIKDSLGESCFVTKMPESEAIPNKVLNSESRWYQGKSLNPTKQSVTRVKKVFSCVEEK